MAVTSRVSNGGNPLTFEQIQRFTPSVAGVGPSPKMSGNYRFYGSVNLIQAMAERGFMPYEASQQMPRKNQADRLSYTKHAVTFRHESYGSDGDVVPQVVLYNSHEGSSSYNLHVGFYRFVCSNGLLVGDTIQTLKVAHRGNHTIEDVIEASFQTLENAMTMLPIIDEWRAITLTQTQRLELAEAAHALRFEVRPNSRIARAVTPELLLTPRNPQDWSSQTTLWATFNILQENLIKGGVKALSDKNRVLVTREINGMEQSRRINTTLWNLASNLSKAA